MSRKTWMGGHWYSRWERWKLGLLVCLVVGTLVLGYLGWSETAPELDGFGLAYRSLALLVLDFPAEHEPPSPLLQVARFIAALIVFGAVFVVIGRVFFKQRLLFRATRMRHHVVIVGDGAEAGRIALNFRATGVKVAAVGDFSPGVVVQLNDAGVCHLPAVTDAQLAGIVRRADRVIVVGADDDSTAVLARRVRRSQLHAVRAGTDAGSVPLTLLLDDQDLATQWNRAGHEHELAISRFAVIAGSVLRATPPVVEAAVTPPAIVVGDGPAAAEIARRIVVGRQQPGEKVIVHCIGTDKSWLVAAAVGVEDRAHFEWTQVAPHPSLIAGEVRRIISCWTPPSPSKYEIRGPRTYVAYAQSAESVPIATAIAEIREASTANPAVRIAPRVVGVVRDASTWSDTISDTAHVHLESTKQLLTSPETLTMGDRELLAEEIVAELGRWPANIPSAIGAVIVAGDGSADLASQEPNVRDAALAVADGIVEILGAADLTLRPAKNDVIPVIALGPDELRAVESRIAEQLRGVQGDDFDASPEGLRVRIELANRLPVLAARAGYAPRRERVTPSPLTPEIIGRLARRAHEQYLRTQDETGNSTNSANAALAWEHLQDLEIRSNYAQVYDIPAKLAMLGLSWRRLDQHAREVPLPSLTSAQIDTASEWEHRRWWHFQVRNGRIGNEFNVPFEELETDVQGLDTAVADQLIESLASVGIGVTTPEPPRPDENTP